MHAAAYAEAEIFWRALGSVEFDAALDRPQTHEQRALGISSLVNFLWGTPGRRVGALAAAFALTFATVLIFALVNQPAGERRAPAFESLATARGETRAVTLSDGSELILGPATRVEVSVGRQERRARLLVGDAYFNIATDPRAPFSVTAGAARVEVIGTAFDLRRRGNRLTVAVAAGEVHVSHPQVRRQTNSTGQSDAWQRVNNSLLQAVTLHPGQSVVAAQGIGLGPIGRIDVSDVAAWRQGQLVYKNARLEEIIADLNRYADFTISLTKPAGDLELSGTFSAEDPSLLLHALEAALPVQITNTPDGKQVALKEAIPPQSYP
ncbi:MAG: FecR domain-containing protein [Pseudomonadota bacterium]